MLNTLVSVSELADNLDNSKWRIIDARFSLADKKAGQAAYNDSHIPDAFYLNLEVQLSSPHNPGRTGRHPLPDKSAWIRAVQALGITTETQVVIYDDAGGAMSARVWWMLRWIGHENVAVLDGGWQSWLNAGLGTTASLPARPETANDNYADISPLVKIVEADDINASRHLIVDARELPRYRGEIEPLDPVAGHIPGALCSPFSGNLNEEGRFQSPQKLKEKFHQVTESEKPVVCYCGSGVTAAHNILAMKIAGLDEPALYPGSWSEWVTDPDRPVAVGDED